MVRRRKAASDGVAAAAPASDGPTPGVERAPAAGASAAAEASPAAITRHRLVLRRHVIDYTATVGATVMRNDAGAPRASVYTFAYTRRMPAKARQAGRRPVVFCFNGGPGSSALYLHFGGFGPVRGCVSGPGVGLQGPHACVPNEDSLLDVADLVFVDPPGTGFARMLSSDPADSALGVNADAELLAAFIRRWLSTHGRWASPLYLMGQSYGALRVAAVARELLGSVGAGQLRAAAVDGLILLGQAVNLGLMQTELRHAFALPTMAALAWQHGRVSREGCSLPHVLREAHAFALARLAPALLQGSELAEPERQAVAEALAGLTGLPAARWLAAGLRLEARDCAEALLGERAGWVSLYDGRYTQPVPTHAVDPVADDPMLAQTAVACHAALQAQLQGPLRCPVDDDYLVINFKLNAAWDWRHREPGAPTLTDFSSVLTSSLHRNPGLRLFVASGAFDLVTPWGAAEHLVTRPGMPRDRVQHQVYAAGHSPYLGDEARAALAGDLREFIAPGAAAPAAGAAPTPSAAARRATPAPRKRPRP